MVLKNQLQTEVSEWLKTAATDAWGVGASAHSIGAIKSNTNNLRNHVVLNYFMYKFRQRRDLDAQQQA
jgi:hypothetical protein